MIFMLCSRGQFFSPDLIIAIFIFVLSLGFFFMASDSIFTHASLIQSKSQIDAVAHFTMDSLVYSPGSPSGWEELPLNDINFIGLADERNIINEKKVDALFDLLSNQYLGAKSKLGVGIYDFKFDLINSSGNVILSGGEISPEALQIFSYDRVVFYLGEPAIIRGYFSYED